MTERKEKIRLGILVSLPQVNHWSSEALDSLLPIPMSFRGQKKEKKTTTTTDKLMQKTHFLARLTIANSLYIIYFMLVCFPFISFSFLDFLQMCLLVPVCWNVPEKDSMVTMGIIAIFGFYLKWRILLFSDRKKLFISNQIQSFTVFFREVFLQFL